MVSERKLKNGKKLSSLLQWAKGEPFALLKLGICDVAEDGTIYWLSLRITWLSFELFSGND